MATPAGGYLWDRAADAGVSYRSYGEFVANGKSPWIRRFPRVKALRGHLDEMYRGFDLDYPDAKRADRFLHELKRFEDEGDMPRLQVVRLPGDHTNGVRQGKRTPSACLADNDAALGRIVEGISHSKFWPQTAILSSKTTRRTGPTTSMRIARRRFVASPYIKRHTVDSTMYSTSSMLRTIELILGLKPMSQFDAAADADVCRVPGQARSDRLHRTARAHRPGSAQHQGHLGRKDLPDDGFHQGRRRR
jgi:hypothetical protein